MEIFNRIADKITAASTAHYLASAQKKNPPIQIPGYPQDYGKKLYSMLEKRLSEEVRQLYSKGKIAIGEIGIFEPNIYVEKVFPAGYVIQVYTGLFHFLYPSLHPKN